MSDSPGTGRPASSGRDPQHPDSGSGHPDTSHGEGERRYVPSDVTAGRWLRRLVLAFALIAGAYAVYLISAAFFPRWWGQRMGDLASGDLTRGTMWGLFFGFVFTFVPLLIVGQLYRRFLSWTWRGILLVLAVVLATPNWLTLAVVVGSSNAAHAGERIMDVDAPGFRNATAIGVGVAVVLFVVLLATGLRSRWQKRRVRDLRGRLAERDQETQDRPRAEPETLDREQSRRRLWNRE